jgi:hypothetical protein
MRRLGSGIAGFGGFWYDFIVGSDPLMAIGVAAGLIATAVLLHSGVNAYWLMPLFVVTTLGISLRGARSA